MSPRSGYSFLIFLFSWLISSPSVAAGACESWVAKIVSIQGHVDVIRTGKTRWQHVNLDETFCAGDSVRIEARSRAAIFLSNQTLLRLDEGTTITFNEIKPAEPSWLEILKGAVYFITRVPRTLKIKTPFVNAAAEGTEFVISVTSTEAEIWVFEGHVSLKNSFGGLNLANGQGAIVKAGKPPVRRILVRPKDAVRWTLYYPPIIDYRKVSFPTEQGMQIGQEVLALYRANNVPDAISRLETLPPESREANYFTLRAGLLLSVGRVDQAQPDIERALALDSVKGTAIALQSIIALAKNENDSAFDLAKSAADLEPRSSVPRVALSYAYQARFEIEKALQSIKEAVELAPDDALVWARLAELELSLGYLDRALAAARKASELDPHLERTQTILGFALLTQINIDEAQSSFERAIKLDSSAPLARLGLGLTKIRRGNLDDGTNEIEISASLDPDNSLIRSYLGKAYFEQKRTELAATEFAIAKELDPKDPTPHFYNAILKQTTNRPVEALRDLQRSIELNDNRAVYRSRLLLDNDLAARSASLGRIYSDLDFEQLALVEGWKSVNTDPGNYSAHRLLADSYAALPRHEIARVSELLQSQLLQPINITPIQPQLAESNLFILEGSGPGFPSFNEFNPLFTRNRLALQASGVFGNNDTFGDELVQSGLWNKYSYSLGQFHFETDGFRENNDVKQDLYNVFFQSNISPKSSIQAEFRYTDTDQGDINSRNGPDPLFFGLRRNTDSKSLRFGYHYSASPNSDLVASVILQKRRDASRQNFLVPTSRGDVNIEQTNSSDNESYSAELQYLPRIGDFNIVAGLGRYDLNREQDTREFRTLGGIPLQRQISPQKNEFDLDHNNIYAYSQLKFPDSLTWTAGISADIFDDNRSADLDRDQVNPKFGIVWNIVQSSIFRAAGFRVLKRTLVANQTIEPTQVAGFNQFFDDPNGTESWRYGFAFDQKFSLNWFGGVELTFRDLEVPLQRNQTTFLDEKRDEQLHRAYLYWTPNDRFAISAEYILERLSRDFDPGFASTDNPNLIKTHRAPLGIAYFDPNGVFATLKATYVDQDAEFPNIQGTADEFSDSFYVIDTSIGYRLPNRWGVLSLDVKNLLDENFRFQDNTGLEQDPQLPLFQPERSIVFRFTLSI